MWWLFRMRNWELTGVQLPRMQLGITGHISRSQYPGRGWPSVSDIGRNGRWTERATHVLPSVLPSRWRNQSCPGHATGLIAAVFCCGGSRRIDCIHFMDK